MIRPQFKRMGFLFMEQEQKYYTLKEEYRERFYQLPKVFFTNSIYQKLSNDAKIAYAILRDRLDLSIKNHWVDNNNAIYFIYTNENLENILNVSKPKVIKIKKELEKVDLLEQKRLGLNKPNMLYLMKPIVTDSDIYQIQNEERPNETSQDKEVKDFNFQKSKPLTSRNKKNSLQEVNKINSNDTDYSDTDIKDTDNNMNNMYTNNSNQSSISDSKNNFDKDSHEKDMILNKYPNQIQSILKTLNSKDCKLAIDIILKAKSNIIKEYGKEFYRYGCDFSLEEHDQEIADTVRRVINEVKSKNSTLQKYQAYLMTSIKNYYKDYADYMLQEQIKRDMVNTDVSNLFKM